MFKANPLQGALGANPLAEMSTQVSRGSLQGGDMVDVRQGADGLLVLQITDLAKELGHESDAAKLLFQFVTTELSADHSKVIIDLNHCFVGKVKTFLQPLMTSLGESGIRRTHFCRMNAVNESAIGHIKLFEAKEDKPATFGKFDSLVAAYGALGIQESELQSSMDIPVWFDDAYEDMTNPRAALRSARSREVTRQPSASLPDPVLDPESLSIKIDDGKMRIEVNDSVEQSLPAKKFAELITAEIQKIATQAEKPNELVLRVNDLALLSDGLLIAMYQLRNHEINAVIETPHTHAEFQKQVKSWAASRLNFASVQG
ncbi:MAG: hypothetical protein KDD62_11905 [Bdellovibrionales bacterium]|nr:hypothetical protein [Bdellovibrionales bacterium]